jgi:RNA polymerase sigma factor (sigma-70 family)
MAQTAGIDITGVFLDQMGRAPKLNDAQMRVLAHRIRVGQSAQRLLNTTPDTTDIQRHEWEAQAKDGLIAQDHFERCNIRLVVSIARRFSEIVGPHQFLDLVQEGTFGLRKAVVKFNPDQPTKFSTMATWWITQAMRRGMTNWVSSIRHPVHIQDTARKVRQAISEYEQTFGGSPTPEQIAEATQISVAKVVQSMTLPRVQASLDQQLSSEDGAASLNDVVPADEPDISEQLAESETVKAVRQALAGLGPQAFKFAQLRWGIGGGDGHNADLASVARRMDMSRPTALRLEASIVNGLRGQLKSVS